MPWYQNYDPLHFWPLSTAMAALPVLTLFFVLLVLKKKVWMAALCGMIVAVALAGSVLKMPALLISAPNLIDATFRPSLAGAKSTLPIFLGATAANSDSAIANSTTTVTNNLLDMMCLLGGRGSSEGVAFTFSGRALPI